jgi:Tfp pilus assembly PilM family ATPase
VVADPFAGLNVTARQVSPEYRAQIAPAFAVALGLAARDAVLGPDK